MSMLNWQKNYLSELSFFLLNLNLIDWSQLITKKKMKSVCRLIKQMKVAAGFFKSGKSSYHLALLLLTSSSTSMALLLMSMPTSALLFLLSELLSQFSRMILQLLMVAESTSPMFHSFIINNLQHLLMFMVYHTTKHKYLLLCIFTR